MPKPFDIRYIDETESTNSLLRKMLDVEDFSVVVADYQTSGRGQCGNRWESERGRNLLFSINLRPETFLASRQFEISEAFCLAVVEVLNTYADGFSIKWPNDIYHLDKKIAGILIEHDSVGKYIDRTIIGIGMNVNQQTFCSDAPNPVSLKQIVGKECERDLLLQRILERFEILYRQTLTLSCAKLHLRYCAHLYRREGYHLFRSEERDFLAQIESVEETGRLVLLDVNGRKHRFAFKEVAYI